MVGLSLACALSNTTYRILVIDSGEKPQSAEIQEPEANGFHLVSGYQSRVSAVSSRSISFLQAIGAWQNIEPKRICSYSNMTIWDAEGTAEIDFGEEESRPQGVIVENKLLQKALFDCALAADNIELIYQSHLSELNISQSAVENSNLKLDSGHILGARLIVGADGGQSAVARYAGLWKKEWSYEQQALVAVVETEHSHRFTAWQCFTSLGPLAFLPLNPEHPHYCSIVWSMPARNCEDALALTDKAFCDHLSKAFEYRLGSVLSTDKRFCFPLRQRHAIRYRRKNVVLVGDAAHTIHPLAGQGVNLGFADAKELAALLRNKLSIESINVSGGDGSVGSLEGRGGSYEKILAIYERKRQPRNLAMMLLMELFKRLYSTHHPIVNWVRNRGMQIFQSTPALKRQIIKAVGGN